MLLFRLPPTRIPVPCLYRKRIGASPRRVRVGNRTTETGCHRKECPGESRQHPCPSGVVGEARNRKIVKRNSSQECRCSLYRRRHIASLIPPQRCPSVRSWKNQNHGSWSRASDLRRSPLIPCSIKVRSTTDPRQHSTQEQRRSKRENKVCTRRRAGCGWFCRHVPTGRPRPPNIEICCQLCSSEDRAVSTI
jgi:hypothetical protein